MELTVRTRMYIDGFNLFHRMLRDQGAGLKWIDLPRLGKHISGNEIDLARYFSASIKMHSGMTQTKFNKKRINQEVLLNAYRADPKIQVHLGLFQLRDKSGIPINKITRKPLGICSSLPTYIKNCFAARGIMTIQSFEEKKTDVNIASYLLKDAYEGKVTQAIIISNDSDLCEPLRICRDDLGIEIIAVNPITIKMKKHSRKNQLSGVATSCYELRPGTLNQFQMPNTIIHSKYRIQKPKNW